MFTVLMVCTGNICRSPVAEILLNVAFRQRVSVGSAGTRALVGRPVAGPMEQLLAAEGCFAPHFSARQLTEGNIKGADLILTMTRHQRAMVVSLHPAAVRRSFTLTEFSRLISETSQPSPFSGKVSAEDWWRGAVPRAARGRRPMYELACTDDIDDPYGRCKDVYGSTFSVIHEAISNLRQRFDEECAADRVA
jgi:protein-tyrosine phosphatase